MTAQKQAPLAKHNCLEINFDDAQGISNLHNNIGIMCSVIFRQFSYQRKTKTIITKSSFDQKKITCIFSKCNKNVPLNVVFMVHTFSSTFFYLFDSFVK